MKRLMDRLAKKFSVNPESECWEWTASVCSAGYGTAWDGNKVAVTHRLVYELLVGHVPDGLELDHLCRNRACVNPAHLEPVTGRENVLRGVGPAALNSRKTHCPRGHAYDGSNTFFFGRHRRCRACYKAFRETEDFRIKRNAGERRRYAKKKEAERAGS